MRNTIVIDTEDLAVQQRAVNESNVDVDVKEGLNELFSSIRDMAQEALDAERGNVVPLVPKSAAE